MCPWPHLLNRVQFVSTGGGDRAFSNFCTDSRWISFVVAATAEEFPLLWPVIMNQSTEISFVADVLHSIKKIDILVKEEM